MDTWPPITRDDLKQAAGLAGFDMTLPLLVRRLIAETAQGLQELDMPGGSGTAAGGFDGVVVARGDSLDVPLGTSVWELSVRRDAQRKADEDYDSRHDGPPGYAATSVTYVQLILAPWKKSRTWQAARTKQRRWREVRAYNLDKIHGWLDRAPATTLWLAEQLGKALPGVRPLEAWFDDTWMPSTRVPLGPEFVLAGRSGQAQQLLEALIDGRQIITIGGDLPPDELRAFVAASIRSGDTTLPLSTRTVHVWEANTLARLIKQPQPLVIVVTDPALVVDLPHELSHQVIIPGGPGASSQLVVPPVDGQAIAELLKTEGEASDRASTLGAMARRSLLALRRSLACNPTVMIPSWGRGPDQVRRRTALVGAWEGSAASDRDAVAACVGVAYEVAQEQWLQLVAPHETPMLGQINEQWHLLSPEDTWGLISPYLTNDDVDAFCDVSLRVLAQRDPLIGLEQGERLAAQMRGEIPPTYSHTLRTGLARTLALMGRSEDPIPVTGQRTGSELARSVVRQLLNDANSDASYGLWTSLTDVLTLIAEAAPSVFLRALDEGLSDDPPLHSRMFADSGDESYPLGGGGSPHTAFLWALEVLAWSQDYLDDVVDILAKLTAIDPGGRWANRPAVSLSEILSSWRPNTSADTETRLRVMRSLVRRHPHVARGVLRDLIPDGHGFQTDHPSPQYRDWRRDVVVTRTDFMETVNAAVDLLLDDLEDDPTRFIAFIDKIDDISSDHRANFVHHLKRLGASLTDDGSRRSVWEPLRDALARHREYADAKWALPEDELVLLDEGLAAIAPRAPVDEVSWLFKSDWIELGDIARRDDYRAHEAAVLERRTHAIGKVLSEGGLDSVLDLASGTSYPHFVGVALAEHTHDVDADMIRWLSQDQLRQSIAYAYVARRLHQAPDAVDEFLDATDDEPSQAMVLRATTNPPIAWEKLGALGDAVAEEYWRNFSYYGLGDFEHVARAVAGLLDAQRYAAALDLIALYDRRSDHGAEIAEHAATALEGLLAAGLGDPELDRLSSHQYRVIFDLLARHTDVIGRQRTVNLEWQYFPALGFEADAPALHEALAEDPAFFVELITLLYKRKGGTSADDDSPSEEMPNDQRRLMASRAFEVLRSWRRCPGTSVDGRVDSTALAEWVSEARSRLTQAGRATVGDQEIGQVLAFAEPDLDGMFPPRSVRELLETVRSDDIESGFLMGLYEKRGVTSRGLYDGGRQEWELAQEAREVSDAANDWPRTKRLYRAVAEGYERHARREDLEAERRRRGLPE